MSLRAEVIGGKLYLQIVLPDDPSQSFPGLNSKNGFVFDPKHIQAVVMWLERVMDNE